MVDGGGGGAYPGGMRPMPAIGRVSGPSPGAACPADLSDTPAPYRWVGCRRVGWRHAGGPLAWVLLLILVLRALVPPGYMPQAAGAGMRASLFIACPGYQPPLASPARHGVRDGAVPSVPAHGHGADTHEGPCVFAALPGLAPAPGQAIPAPARAWRRRRWRRPSFSSHPRLRPPGLPLARGPPGCRSPSISAVV